MVRSRATRQPRHLRVLLLAAVGGIVFGIIGMHGLGQDHMTASDAHHSLSAAQSMPMGAMPADTIDGHDHGKNPSDPEDHCGMLALCLAAIAGGALLLWVAFVAYRRRPTAHLKRTANTVRTFVQSVFRPPPDLIRLSILRC